MIIHVPVSVGELFDKITILKIKYEMIKDKTKHAAVEDELTHLNHIVQQHVEMTDALQQAIDQLAKVNRTLWQIEDDVRACEKNQDFSEAFITLARSVYKNNDQRAKIKGKINELTHSMITEVKSYEEY